HSRASGNAFMTYLPGADLLDKPVYSLMESPSGRIWCGSRGGLYEVLSNIRFRREPLPGVERTIVTSILEDTAGKLWVATIEGIFVIGKNGAAQRITKEDGLPDNWVNALLLDPAGRLWAGTRKGLVLMRDEG